MRIIIICNGCKSILQIKDKAINFASDELTLEVEACRDKDCYVCEGCEEVEAKEKMEEKLVAIKTNYKCQMKEMKERGKIILPSCFGTWRSRKDSYISKPCSNCPSEKACKFMTGF